MISGDSIFVDDSVRLPAKPVLGKASKTAGRTAVRALGRAVNLALKRDVEGIVTAPVSKESLAMAGYGMVGHTEVLAELTRTRDYAMMLENGDLRVVFATTHLRHRDVARRLTRVRLLKTMRLTRAYFERYLGIKDPRIGIACLNPHCGEGGLLGREEQDVIEPAVKAARHEGICVEGPLPADSIYRPVIADGFDVIIAMYHDQGMIPLKLRGHGDVVNITLGIPIVRTSAGHGTAFDIAGDFRASDRSMASAILECARIVKRLRDAG
jgi:4-hydroxythreonine-4-phosphate dehydrogenase